MARAPLNAADKLRVAGAVKRRKDAIGTLPDRMIDILNADRSAAAPHRLLARFTQARVEASALAALLIEKGLITEVEYNAALADAAEAEVARLQTGEPE
jgi:hypothetical protein